MSLLLHFYLLLLVAILTTSLSVTTGSQKKKRDLLLEYLTGSHNNRRKLCRHDQFMPGEWIRTNITEKLYVSCGSHANDWRDPAVSMECTNEGVFGEQESVGPKTKLTLIGGHASVCDEADHTRWAVSERERYVWQPKQCELLLWDAQLFCALLRDRKILFLGDSTMQQTFASFVNMINWRQNETMCAEQLSWVSVHGIYKRYEEELSSWNNILHAHRPDILIIGFGAHYTHFGNNFNIFGDSVRTLFDLINHTQVTREQEQLKPMQVLWKTNNPGHVNCDSYQHPLDHYLAADPANDRYKWEFFPYYDETFQAVLNLSEYALQRKHIHTLSVEPLYFRPDSHPGRRAWDWLKVWGGDCLHYCSPGALDVIPILFMHWMLFH